MNFKKSIFVLLVAIAITATIFGDTPLAFRGQFWVSTYSSIEVEPYESVTLHFKGSKNTNEFSLNESDVYTTSGIMAYALCGSVQSSNAKILGFTALNTVLLFTGIGEFNAALQAGRAGRMAWAAADVGLGLGGILIETKYKDQLTQTENGRTVLKIWEGLNLLYGGARITLELYNLCKSSRDAISQLKKEVAESGDQETLVALNETETQANNVEKSGVGSPISFFENVGDAVPSLLAEKLTEEGARKLKAWTSARTLKYKSLNGEVFTGLTTEGKIFEDLSASIGNKNILLVFEDTQGRLLIKTDAVAVSETKVISLEKTVSGDFKIFEYKVVYAKGKQAGFAPLSENGLAPDFSKMPNKDEVLFPVTGNQENIVRIKLSGKRNGIDGDFDRANKAARIEGLIARGKWKPDDYTWHHLDDFDSATGECTMQLVKTSEHIKTLPHTASVKQWENYTGQTYGN